MQKHLRGMKIMANILISWLLWIAATVVIGILAAICSRGRYSGYLQMLGAIISAGYIIFSFIMSAKCLPVILTMDKGWGALLIGFMVLSAVAMSLSYCAGKKILLRHYRRKLGWQ